MFGDGVGEVVVCGGESRGAFDGGDGVGVESDGVCSVSPLAAEDVVGEVVFFVGSSGEGGDAGAVAGGDASLGHLGFDVATALAELAAHPERDAGDLADAVAVDFAVEEYLRLGEFVAQDGLEDGFGGVADVVELAGVDAGDAAVGSSAGVGDNEVAVEVRVAESAGVVVKAGDHEAVAVVVVETAVASAHDGGFGFEELDDGGFGSVDGVFDVAAGVVVADAPEHRHRFGDAEGDVEGGDLDGKLGERGAGVGSDAFEDGSEVVGVDGAGEAELFGEGAVPLAGAFEAAVVLVGVVLVEFVEVVLGVADLADGDHRRSPAAPGRVAPGRRRSRRTPLVYWCEPPSTSLWEMKREMGDVVARTPFTACSRMAVRAGSSAR